MANIYEKYFLPVIILSVVGISFFKELNRIKKETDPHTIKKMKKKYAIVMTITFF